MRVNQELLEKLEAKLGKSRRRIYELISERVNENKLPRNLAAIDLASDYNINIMKYATKEELDELRLPSQRGAAASVSAGDPRQDEKKKARATGRPKTITRKPKKGDSVFVVHGRDDRLRKAMFSFLRAIDLKPIEWRRALEFAGKPSPYIGEVLAAAFRKATAVVILLTPDDEARLRKKFVKENDPGYEAELTGQPRPNVLFEAGMAFATHQDNTVLVQVGDICPFSDVAGRHIVHLSNSPESRQELVTKLRSCGCTVDESGSDWMSEGNFE